MAPPTFPPNPRAASTTSQPLSTRHGIQASRMPPRNPDHLRNTHARINEAMHTLSTTRQAISDLESHHHRVIEAKDAEMAILQQRFSGLNTLHKTTKARLDDKVLEQGKLHDEVKTLKQQVAFAKAKKGFAGDELKKQVVDVGRQNALLTTKVWELERELESERARGRANRDAKRELEVMKAKLADMVGGVKVKVETIE